MSMGTLQMRLQHCIQSILDLEAAGLPEKWLRSFAPELRLLQKSLAQLSHMCLYEDVVCRLEDATNTFLAELQIVCKKNLSSKRLLQ
jgi:hypothetical protein